jgi:Kef-type K+ transport system membrane component KefB
MVPRHDGMTAKLRAMQAGLADPSQLDPTQIPLAVLTVFAAARLMREIFERLRQPGIVGEILAGLLVGPHVLGWIRPNDFLTALSELGVMFLLFGIGLEVKTSDLLRTGSTAIVVAVSGVAFSFVMAGGVALLWHRPPIEAMFIAAAMVATSVVITAEVLSSRGLLHARASRVILASAVVDDILGLIVLAIVSGSARGRMNWFDLILTAVLAICFTLFLALWGHRAVKLLLPGVRARLRLADAEFTLAITLLLGLLAVYAGVAAIIGAFLAGMALSETVEVRVRTMTAGVSELLVPFFLVGIGLRLDPAVFANTQTIFLALSLLVAALLSKLIGCGLGAFRLGKADALRVGTGMAPRGEVGMVVAQLGRKMGVMPDSIFAIIIFLSIATTLAAPPMIRLAFRGAPLDPARE